MPTQKVAQPQSKPLDVLAMGGGVQTTTILMMAYHGELPKPDHIIFADLGWEKPAVYEHLEWLQKIAKISRIPFHVIHTGDIRNDAIRSNLYQTSPDAPRWAQMPLFSLDVAGNHGQLRRQCTLHYKIRPIDRYIKQNLLGLQPRQHAPQGSVRLWFGISADEPNRVHASDLAWKIYHYPLVDEDQARDDCHYWLDRNGYHHPARSSCLGCPYRSNAEWHWLRANDPDAYADVVQWDRQIRHPDKIAATLYVHRDRLPLAQADLAPKRKKTTPPQRLTECWGYCDT